MTIRQMSGEAVSRTVREPLLPSEGGGGIGIACWKMMINPFTDPVLLQKLRAREMDHHSARGPSSLGVRQVTSFSGGKLLASLCGDEI